MDKIKQFEPFFGEWYAESFIGAGSFGRVYKIYRDELNNRFYSALKYISIPSEDSELKQLRADGMDDESISTYYGSLAQNVSSEITLMNRLKGNTNIISFEDSRVIAKPGGVGYDIFIRMELLESLTNRIVSAPLPAGEVVKLGVDICSALMLCAKNGIIHRDVKPDNIFISPNGDYKLGDFGVARQLENSASFMSKKGTYNYMAPEVYKGDQYGATCDIYSLGLVMYRLLNNGRLPFLPPAPAPINPEERELAIIRRMKGEAFDAPCAADPALSRIVLKASAYDPKDRYASAEEMYRDLFLYRTGIQKAAPVEAQPEADIPFPTRLGKTEKPAEQAQPAPEPGPEEPMREKETPSRLVWTARKSEPAPEKERAPEPAQQEPAAQTWAAHWTQPEPQAERRAEPEPQKDIPQRTLPEEPKPQKEPAQQTMKSREIRPAATDGSDGGNEAAELKKMIGYFSQKADRYKEYDRLAAQIARKPKTNPLFLILAIAIPILACCIMSTYGLLTLPVSGLFVWLFIRKNKQSKAAYQDTTARFDAAAEELYAHYTNYGACGVKPEYTNPEILKAILSAVLSGTASTAGQAIAQLNMQAAQKNPALAATYSAAAAANAARRARVPVVFRPEGMFRFR